MRLKRRFLWKMRALLSTRQALPSMRRAIPSTRRAPPWTWRAFPSTRQAGAMFPRRMMPITKRRAPSTRRALLPRRMTPITKRKMRPNQSLLIGRMKSPKRRRMTLTSLSNAKSSNVTGAKTSNRGILSSKSRRNLGNEKPRLSSTVHSEDLKSLENNDIRKDNINSKGAHQFNSDTTDRMRSNGSKLDFPQKLIKVPGVTADLRHSYSSWLPIPNKSFKTFLLSSLSSSSSSSFFTSTSRVRAPLRTLSPSTSPFGLYSMLWSVLLSTICLGSGSSVEALRKLSHVVLKGSDTSFACPSPGMYIF